MSVYSIQCKCGLCYIGSTKRSLTERQYEHRSEFCNPNRTSFHSFVYSHFRDCGMEKDEILCKLIEETNFETLKQQEPVWIDMCGDLNTFDSIPNLLKIEARKLKYKEIGKIINLCDCGGSWSYKHKARHFKIIKHKQYVDDAVKRTLEQTIKEINKILMGICDFN